MRSIGADQVIDYTQEDFTQNGQCYGLILDNVGNRSISDLKRALSPQGVCVIVGFTSLLLLFQHMFLGSLMSNDWASENRSHGGGEYKQKRFGGSKRAS